MRLGRVEFSVSYVVDIDNPEMVARAEDAVFDDVWMMGKDRDINRHIRVRPADANDSQDDISTFLLDQEEN